MRSVPARWRTSDKRGRGVATTTGQAALCIASASSTAADEVAVRRNARCVPWCGHAHSTAAAVWSASSLDGTTTRS
eukprot:scaffold35432_cov27-Tisochrysis_lutea.AAC.4